jgi:hypothetical protein
MASHGKFSQWYSYRCHSNVLCEGEGCYKWNMAPTGGLPNVDHNDTGSDGPGSAVKRLTSSWLVISACLLMVGGLNVISFVSF